MNIVDNSIGYTIVSGMDTILDLTTISDEELLARSLKNPALFELLVSRHQKHFLEKATYILKSKDDAEDCVQDTFVRIYRFAPNFQGSVASFRSWSVTILMNVIRTRYQKKAKEWARHAPLSQEHYETLPAPSQKDSLHAKDIIERALECVPEETAVLIRLAYIEELPYQQIAAKLSLTVGAVKTRVHRAKKVLKQTIGDIRI